MQHLFSCTTYTGLKYPCLMKRMIEDTTLHVSLKNIMILLVTQRGTEWDALVKSHISDGNTLLHISPSFLYLCARNFAWRLYHAFISLVTAWLRDYWYPHGIVSAQFIMMKWTEYMGFQLPSTSVDCSHIIYNWRKWSLFLKSSKASNINAS